MAIENQMSSEGTVKTELRENAVGLPGMLMQGIATIAPSFAILASFVFIVNNAGIVTPWAYLFGGALLALQALNAAQLAKVFPSAGGWYTWIARALHPRAGFFAGVLFSVWLPPVLSGFFSGFTASRLSRSSVWPLAPREFTLADTRCTSATAKGSEPLSFGLNALLVTQWIVLFPLGNP